MRIAFLGAGAWGTALAKHASGQHSVMLVARDADQARAISNSRQNQRYLPGVAIAANTLVSANIDEALNWLNAQAGSLIVISSALSGLVPILEQIRLAGDIPNGLIWLCKGLLSAQLPSAVVANTLPQLASAPLFGPSFALEVAQGLPAALTVATLDDRLAALAVEAFHHGAIRVYRSDDVVGVELGGALKNVIAIATGICDGLALGTNARAALVTRGLAEMARLGLAMGAHNATFMGLTGLGDLVLTSTGDLSRNRRVGLQLACGKHLDDILPALGHVAEGVSTVTQACALARRHRVDMPICEAVEAVLNARLSPRDAVSALLAREPKREN